jgi:hypothetical protein
MSEFCGVDLQEAVDDCNLVELPREHMRQLSVVAESRNTYCPTQRHRGLTDVSWYSMLCLCRHSSRWNLVLALERRSTVEWRVTKQRELTSRLSH